MSALPASDYWLYRIIRFDRFVEMLETDKWFFAHPSEWEDPYERLIKNSLSNALFAQCWCRKGVSDAMWRIYSQDNLGIRVRTSKQRLKIALLREAAERGLCARIASVKYLNELQYVARTEVIKYNLKQAPTFARSCAHLFLKRLAFEHEAETRVVVYDPTDLSNAPRRSIKIKLDTRQLIDSVLVDPRAPEPFVEAYRMLLKDKLKFPGSVKKSQLYRSGEVREA